MISQYTMLLRTGIVVLFFTIASGFHISNESGTNITTIEIIFLRGNDYIENETMVAIEMAEELLRRQQKIPPMLQFNVMDINACLDSKEMNAFEPLLYATQQYFSGPDALDIILGPHCSPGMKYVARLAKERNLPIIGYNSVSSEFSDRAEYPTLARVSITTSSLGQAAVAMLRHLNVKQVGVVKDPDNASAMWIYIGVINAIAKTDIKVNVDVEAKVKMKNKMSIDVALKKLKDNARIIVVTMAYGPSKPFMELLTQHNMTGPEYLYIVPCGAGFFSTKDLVSDTANVALSKALMVHAEGMDPDTYNAFHDRMRIERDVVFWTEGYRYWELYYRTAYQVIHDSLYVAMLVASQLVSENKTHILNDGLKFWSYLQNRHFIGASGHVWIDGNGERLPDYIVDTVVGNEIKRVYDMNIAPVCEGKCAENEGQIIGKVHYKWFPKLVWTDYCGKPPDVPECGFRGELCDKTKYYVTFFVVVLSLILTALGYRAWKKMKEDKLHRMPWRVQPEQLLPINNKRALGSLATIKTDQNSVASGYLNVVLVGRELCTVTVFHQDKAAEFSRTTLAALNELKKTQHENLSALVGLCFDTSDKEFQILWSTGARGSLQNLMIDRDIELDAIFQASFIRDIIRGLEFIHNSPIGSHGSLHVGSCYVTQQWMVKVSHFGTQSVLEELCHKSVITYEMGNFAELVHIAPELLRENDKLAMPQNSSQKGDIYSLGMVIYQILYRATPFANPEDVVNKILIGYEEVAKPIIPEKSIITSTNLENLQACWSVEEDRRPNITVLKSIASNLSPAKGGLVDNMMKMMDRYAGNLERLVRERTSLLEDAQRQADTLLFRMLPQSIAQDLKAGKAVEPQLFQTATVSFTDIVGFTPLCSKSTPIQIVTFLNGLYSRYDEIIASHDAYKVETIGDAYLVVSGLPNRNGNRHALEICTIGLAMRQCANNFKLPHIPNQTLKVRVGIDSGPVAAGVIGITAPRYCIFGDTVNTASRMESTGEAMKIQMSHDTKILLDRWAEKFVVQERGEVSVKGKGQLMVYWLESSDM